MFFRFPARISELERVDDRLLLLGTTAEAKHPRVDPGQFFHLAIDSYQASSHWPESRAFSIAHNSRDGDYRFIISRSGAFVERLWHEASLGNRLWLKGPYGELNIELNDIPFSADVIFVAAGSGVSPFPSLISRRVQGLQEGISSMTLLYSARSEALLTERRFFSDLKMQHPKTLDVEFFVTQDSPQRTELRAVPRRITPEDLLAHVRDLATTHLFLSGPTPLVATLRDRCISSGLPAQNVHFDKWG